jgi:DNA polymerase (family 10)
MSGRSSLLERLREEVPPGALVLSQIPGLTLKKIKKLDAALGISSIDDLKAAIAAGRLKEVPGFGPKSESALLEQISRYENRENRILLFHALRIAENVIVHLRSYPSLVSVDLAGAARRWKETVSMIRITAAGSRDREELLEHFLSFPLIAEIEDRKKDAVTVRLIQGAMCACQLLLPTSIGSLLHRETGLPGPSKEA